MDYPNGHNAITGVLKRWKRKVGESEERLEDVALMALMEEEARSQGVWAVSKS